jgi:hypothetical protein
VGGEDKLHLGIKNERVHFILPSVCITLPKGEDKLHLGIKNERVHFILPSVCITLPEAKISCTSA